MGGRGQRDQTFRPPREEFTKCKLTPGEPIPPTHTNAIKILPEVNQSISKYRGSGGWEKSVYQRVVGCEQTDSQATYRSSHSKTGGGGSGGGPPPRTERRLSYTIYPHNPAGVSLLYSKKTQCKTIRSMGGRGQRDQTPREEFTKCKLTPGEPIPQISNPQHHHLRYRQPY